MNCLEGGEYIEFSNTLKQTNQEKNLILSLMLSLVE